MQEYEISFYPTESDNIYKVNSKFEVDSYTEEDDGTEHIEYSLYSISIEREDGSELEVESEELELILETYDKDRVYNYVLEAYKYGV